MGHNLGGGIIRKNPVMVMRLQVTKSVAISVTFTLVFNLIPDMLIMCKVFKNAAPMYIFNKARNFCRIQYFVLQTYNVQ